MRKILSSILLLSTISVLGQMNLIPSSSFEENISFGTIKDTQDWNKCMKNDTPDQFRFYTNSKKNKEYSEYICGPLPVDGNAYLGIFCYRTNPLRGIDNVREVIQVKLKERLQKDSIYTLKIHTALDPESTHAIKNLNVAFSSTLSSFKNEKELFKTYTQIRFKDQWLSDTSWTELKIDYKARGNEQYMMIGNFLKDASTLKKPIYFNDQSSKTKKWNLYEKETASYYYFDALSLRKKTNDVLPSIEENEIDPPVVVKEEPLEEVEEITIDKVKEDSVFVLEKIYFEFDKATILPESHNELRRLLNFMNTYPEIKILVEGHTDEVGTYEYNMVLSLRRAKAVVEYLSDHGIDSSRMEHIGYGYTRPLIENRESKKQKINRRVAFSIIQ